MKPLALLTLAACGSPPAPAPTPKPPAMTWLKGQLHVHTNRSGDSTTPPDEVAAWYAAHGFDFIVLTDHNVPGGLDPAPLLVLPGVELTTNLQTCDPPEGDHPCLLHVNALAIDLAKRPSKKREDGQRAHVLEDEIAIARELGGIAQLNHPNFHYSASAELVTKLAGSTPLLVEFENQTEDSMNEGDGTHPSTQALWDRVLALGATVYGTATDDAHHYNDAAAVRARGEPAYVGDRGFVMVDAKRDRDSIATALARGEFYASNGVVLTGLEVDATGMTIRTATPMTIECRSATKGVVSSVKATEHRCARSGIVRAVVTDDAGDHAWTQAIRESPGTP